MWSRTMMITAAWVIFSLHACLQPNTSAVHSAQTEKTVPWFVNQQGDTIHTISKDDAVWKSELNPMEYYVLREKGTERAFSGQYHNSKAQGVYHCAGCDLPLFTSETKFDSGTGWPSFYQPLDPTHVAEITDASHGMRRTEVVCHKCGGHLGHVFDDGPRPTGLRYCMNSVSLTLVEE